MGINIYIFHNPMIRAQESNSDTRSSWVLISVRQQLDPGGHICAC